MESYQSLVHLPHELSPALTKLTGITSQQLLKAPTWEKVLPHLQELSGATLLAHNADFEKSFLSSWLEKVERPRWGDKPSEFVDSLFLFPLLDPSLSQLSLEHILRVYGLKAKEDHRALEDARDLVRALVRAKLNCFASPVHSKLLNDWIEVKGLNETWYAHFLRLEKSEVEQLAHALDLCEAEIAGGAENPVDPGQQSEEFSQRVFPQVFSGQELESFFKNEEALQKIYPHYKARSGQISMANRVGQCLKNQKHALIQAPTGTGKTFAYLVPALSFVEHHPHQVLIATGTKALQAQAMEKDLPALLKLYASEKPPKVAKLIGSSNHWCEMLVRSQQSEFAPQLLGSREFQDHFFDLYLEVLFHFHDQGRFFNRDDFPVVLKSKIKTLAERERAVAVDFRSCLGNRCPYRGRCGYIEGLRVAREANIIVGNHALMFQWPKSQDRPKYIIVDEAHRLESESTRALTLSATQNSLEFLLNQIDHAQGVGALFYLLAKKKDEAATELINQIRHELLDWSAIAREHWEATKEQAEVWFRQSPRFTEQFWNERPFPLTSSETSPLSKALANRLSSLGETLQQMNQVLLPHLAWAQIQDWKSDEEKLAFGRFETFLGQLTDHHQVFSLAIASNADYVHSLKFHQEFGLALESAPLNVGKAMYDSVLTPSEAVVMTSATLCSQNASDSRGMEWLTGYTYLTPERRFKAPLVLGPVFDYANRAKVFLATDMPKFSDLGFVPMVLEKTLPVIRHLQGKSLLLFSSRLRFDQATDYLLKNLGHEVEIFIQGMGKTVVEDFKKSSGAVLIGMESFGEGIDIPGEGLQFLLIDKIPDLRQELVIEKRREFFEREFGQEFRDYFMAHRASSLHQKLGRLLRTPNDFGAAIVVDSRAQSWKGRTLADFFQLMQPYQLQPCKLSEAVEGAVQFLASSI